MELTLNQKLSLIQKEFKASKSKFNSFGKYNFRSAEDILEALKPYNEKYQVNFTITESMVESQFLQFPMLRSVASISDDLDTITASAIVGVDLEQKGMQMPQKFGSASSYAKKYALGNLLLIDDTQDPDASNKHDKAEISSQKINPFAEFCAYKFCPLIVKSRTKKMLRKCEQKNCIIGLQRRNCVQ